MLPYSGEAHSDLASASTSMFYRACAMLPKGSSSQRRCGRAHLEPPWRRSQRPHNQGRAYMFPAYRRKHLVGPIYITYYAA